MTGKATTAALAASLRSGCPSKVCDDFQQLASDHEWLDALRRQLVLLQVNGAGVHEEQPFTIADLVEAIGDALTACRPANDSSPLRGRAA